MLTPSGWHTAVTFPSYGSRSKISLEGFWAGFLKKYNFLMSGCPKKLRNYLTALNRPCREDLSLQKIYITAFCRVVAKNFFSFFFKISRKNKNKRIENLEIQIKSTTSCYHLMNYRILWKFFSLILENMSTNCQMSKILFFLLYLTLVTSCIIGPFLCCHLLYFSSIWLWYLSIISKPNCAPLYDAIKYFCQFQPVQL